MDRKRNTFLLLSLQYVRKHWVIYAILFAYFISLSLNAFGIAFWLPSCPIKEFTGYECLGCGMSHAFMALLKFDFEEALHHNPMVFIIVPALLIWVIIDFYKHAIQPLNKHHKNEYISKSN